MTWIVTPLLVVMGVMAYGLLPRRRLRTVALMVLAAVAVGAFAWDGWSAILQLVAR